MNIFNKMFGTYSEKEVKRIRKMYVNTINKLENEISHLSDDELKAKTPYLKEKLSKGETLEQILPEAFAIVREASKRTLGMRHFDVQLIGGIVLHQGRIAEMKTGEGKTLVATLPVYLNALTGKGAHIVTVNDYLANRDLETMKPLYDFLGVSSGVITSKTSQLEKKEIYNLDIVYITNTELGFDYLRDNMVKKLDDKVQRKFNFAVVDEVDSILIDEARTPLIVSAMSDKPTDMYNIVDVFVQSLKEDDIIKDEKLKTVMLSETGVEKAEKIFGIKNYSDIEHNILRHHIKQSLQANFQLKKDKDYIVKNNEVILIDEFTGRTAVGRRYSNGLHQAIEAKEGVTINKETITLATITYQNFFKMYNKLSGMTGTGETEQQEFNVTYGLDVIVVPTNLPIARTDKSDKLYMTENAKILGIIKDIRHNYEKGRPVLVGTPSIEKSEQLSELLIKEGVPHQVLNAKRDDIEAEIVANAGQKNSITIATNMAGRGTDIKLGDGVIELGGLKVIGTERADNRRIDNQLRGRSGRQGDPGASQFYTSFEDNLIVFATEKFKTLISGGSQDDIKPIKNKMMDNIIEKCQKMTESQHFEMRKTTTEYDDVVNKQREIIYNQRNQVLESTDLTEQLENMIKEVLTDIVIKELESAEKSAESDDLKPLVKALEPEYFDANTIVLEEIQELKTTDEIKDYIIKKALEILNTEKETLNDRFIDIARNIIITNVDEKWQNHIEDLDRLKRDVKLMAYKQVNPIDEFTSQAYDLINQMSYDIENDTIKYILKMSIYESEKIEELMVNGNIEGEKIISK